ncbi:MAG: nicotinamide n-methyltransferase [Chrysothrix sp. TS-e1954]|nr:MAG: nicotinamide n-methyltransferase [Chrysothrix sp. TS-e1954]
MAEPVVPSKSKHDISPSSSSEASSDDDGETLTNSKMFDDPPSYREKPASHTYREHTMDNGKKLRLRLVGFDPLYAHLLFHSAIVLAGYLERNSADLVRDRLVLELGAGCGLPGQICALQAARRVVMTDFPSEPLLENLRWQIGENLRGERRDGIAGVAGYRWGDETSCLSNALIQTGLEGPEANEARFDTVILSDLLFNHNCHQALVKTVIKTLRGSEGARALVFTTPHRPWLLREDLDFFNVIKGVRRRSMNTASSGQEEEGGFIVPPGSTHWMGTLGRKPGMPDDEGTSATAGERSAVVRGLIESVAGRGEVFIVELVGQWQMGKPMLEDDEDDDELRSTVYGWEIRWDTNWQQEMFGR